MKKLLTLLSFVLLSTICLAQNPNKTYDKHQFKSLIDGIDKSELTQIHKKESIANGDLYLNYDLIGYYQNDSLVKMHLKFDNKLDSILETYYFDKEGYLIYSVIEEYQFSLLMAFFEIRLYSKDKILFALDTSKTYFTKEEKIIVLRLIKEDIEKYKLIFNDKLRK